MRLLDLTITKNYTRKYNKLAPKNSCENYACVNVRSNKRGRNRLTLRGIISLVKHFLPVEPTFALAFQSNIPPAFCSKVYANEISKKLFWLRMQLSERAIR